MANIFKQSAGAYTDAISAANAAAGFRPANVGTNFDYQADTVGTKFGYNPSDVSARTAVGGIKQYMNPYTKQVIDKSMADLERQRQMQMGDIGASAVKAGAFGGSRHGVAEALTNQGFAQQGGQLAAQMRQQGFNTALGASQQDVANRLQASIANQNAGARAAEFGQSTRLNAQQSNQNAINRANEFAMQNRLSAQQANQNAGISAAQIRSGAAGQLGNLSQQGFNYGNTVTQNQAAYGEQQQQMNQALIDAIKGQYGGFTGAPQNSLALLMSAIGLGNMGQGTTTQTNNPGLFDYISAIFSAIPKG